MRKMHVFLLNGAILTGASLLLRLGGVWFNAYISRKIGTEGMGLYTLVMSVYSLAVTASIFGMGLACTRLVAEEAGKKNFLGVRYSVKVCVFLGAFCGILSAALLYFFSDFVGTVVLRNEKTVVSIKAFAVCLPFLSVSGILNGYFTSVGRILKSSAVSFAELFTRIFAISVFLNFVFPNTLEYGCLSVVLGGTVAETLSCVYYCVIYLFDCKRYKKTGTKKGIRRRIFKIAVPVALSSCLKSGLSAIKHVMIPIQLGKSGMSASAALSEYGIIQGMVMPVIMFPSSVVAAFSSLIIPEFSQLSVANDPAKIKRAISMTFKITLLFSVGVSGFLIYYSAFLGMNIYKSSEAGVFIRLLAPLSVMIYIDMAADSILKGINQQVGVVKINIIDTVICIFMIYFLLPSYSVIGYVFVIFASEILNGALSVNMLIKSTGFEMKFVSWVLKPTAAVLATAFFIYFTDIRNTFSSMMAFCVVYTAFLGLFGCLGKEK